MAANLRLSGDHVRTQLVNTAQGSDVWQQPAFASYQRRRAGRTATSLSLSLSVETDELVPEEIQRLLDDDVSGGRDFDNMSKIVDSFPAAARDFTQQLPQPQDRPGAVLLRSVIDNSIVSAAEKFPKRQQGFSTWRLVSNDRSSSTRNNCF